MSDMQRPANQGQQTGVAPVVERNIHALLARRQAEEARMGWQEKLAVTIANFTGSMLFLYLHVLIYGLWIAVNCGWFPGVPRFDPTLVILAMVASVEAIFLSSFILITQNRMMAQADRRANLSLQISLLAEHEITRLITMVRELAKQQGIEQATKPELEELAQDVAPEQVLETMQQQEERARAEKELGRKKPE